MVMQGPITASGSSGSREVYSQTTDPGAVGAGEVWIDTSVAPALIYVRNATNTAWVAAGGGGGGGATIWTSAYAAPPAAVAGDAWLPTDSFYILRCSA